MFIEEGAVYDSNVGSVFCPQVTVNNWPVVGTVMIVSQARVFSPLQIFQQLFFWETVIGS